MTKTQLATHGLIAGAAGTCALNVMTYLDVAVRGRPTSSVPAQTVDKATDIAGVSLSAEGSDSETAANRREGAGSLLGYMTGLGLGLVYAVARTDPARRFPAWATGTALGLGAMAATDVPYAALGVSNPRQWGVKGWLSDIVPHVVYGVITAATFDEVAS